MVGVAQLVEHWVVVPGVAGSNPVTHPTLLVAVGIGLLGVVFVGVSMGRLSRLRRLRGPVRPPSGWWSPSSTGSPRAEYDPARPGSAAIAGYEAGIYRLLLCVGSVLVVVGAALAVVPRDPWKPVLAVFPALIPVAVGLLFAGIGALGIRRLVRLQRSGIEASGVVVSETMSSSRPGEQVIVRYDGADPGRMLLRGDGVEPIFVIFTPVGLVVLGVGLTITYNLLA